MEDEQESDNFSRYYYRDDTEEETVETISFLDSLKVDLGMLEPIHKSDTNMEDNVFNFARVPFKVEQILFHGFFMCLDSLLFMVTYLPMRIVRAMALLLYSVVLKSWSEKAYAKIRKHPELGFHRTQFYDLVRGVLLIIALYTLLQMQMSKIYHFIRGQDFMKLYVIFNMLDIFDRLFCTFGQDIVDSLYWAIRYTPRKLGAITSRFVICLLYTIAHSFLYFLRVITLNAAINSESSSLLTILISNNFVELKGSVFKRYAQQNLFQITCSDIVERFELFTFLVITGLQSSVPWYDFLSACMFIWCGEIIVDWTKHIFIIKFNRIQTTAYENFREALSRDMAPRGGSKDPYPSKKKMLDHTQTVAQRIGLATLPLTCVVLRFVWLSLPEHVRNNPFETSHMIVFVLGYLNLLAMKTLLSTLLKGSCCRYLMSRERSLYKVVSPRGPITSEEKAEHRAVLKKHMDHIDQLSGIRRYMIYNSRVPT